MKLGLYTTLIALLVVHIAGAQGSSTFVSHGASVVSHGSRKEKKIALTFDACSTRVPSHYDDRVTKVLVDTHTPATLFLGGKWIEEEIKHAKYLASLSQFEFGNHTYSHPHLTQISEEEVRNELQKTQKVFQNILGLKPTLFRPPYGEYNPRVVDVASKLGLQTIEFDVTAGDPDILFTKEIVINYVTKSAKNGSIIVMHINRRGWHTAEALPEIIRRLRELGFQLVKVSELSPSDQK